MYTIEIIGYSDTQDRTNEKLDVLITSCKNGLLGGGGVGCHFSPSRSNTKNKNKSPMLIPIIFPDAQGNHKKCIVIMFILYTVYNLVS